LGLIVFIVLQLKEVGDFEALNCLPPLPIAIGIDTKHPDSYRGFIEPLNRLFIAGAVSGSFFFVQFICCNYSVCI